MIINQGLKKRVKKKQFNPVFFVVFLNKNRTVFFFLEKNTKTPILNCFCCIMQYHHFQNDTITTFYTYQVIQICG